MNPLRKTATNVASLLTMVCATFASTTLTADTVTVGPDANVYDYTDIQSAIDAASDSGFTTIQVAEGTYTSTANNVVNYDGKWIYIIATGNREKTIIDGEGTRRCVLCFDAPEAVLKGFTIRNGGTGPTSGYANGHGIAIENSSINVVDCIISGHLEAQRGAGAYVHKSVALFAGCTFRSNEAAIHGSALYLYGSQVNLFSSSIRDNHATYAAAIDFRTPDVNLGIDGSLLRIKDTLFCQNTTEHIEVSTGNAVEDLGNNAFKDVCPEFEALLGFDFDLELAFYVPIPPCDPLGELAANVMPVDNPDAFGDPGSMAVTPQGGLAIVDREYGIVHGYNHLENAYEGTLFQSDALQQPVAIAFDEGFGYVADAAGMIHMFNPTDGSEVGIIRNEMLSPVDMEIDPDGLLWVTCANDGALLQGWDPQTGGMAYAFSGELPGFEMPGAIGILPDGDILVADRADSEIFRVDPERREVTTFLSAQSAEELGLGEIFSLECAPDTRVYVLSARGVSRFTSGGWFMSDILDDMGALTGITDFITVEPDPHPWELADFNFDGVVDGADLAQLLGAWGSSVPDFDLVRDGVIDGADLAHLLGAWGPSQG